MWLAIAKRVAVAAVLLVTVSAVLFFGVSALPGDAAIIVLGQQAGGRSADAGVEEGRPSILENLRREYGLDRPVTTRYFEWFSGFVQGDLGRSLTSQQSVWSLIRTNVRNTAILALAVVLLVFPVAIVLGILSALWRDRLADHAVAMTTLTFISTPEFVVGAVLVACFSFWLGLLPAASLLDSERSIFSQLSVLALPVLTLFLVSVAQSTRMIRAAMIEVLHSDYIEAATLRGVPRLRILFFHALPNAFDAIIQIIAMTIPWLIGGVVVTETLFSYPGLGTAIVDAVGKRDVPLVVGAAMLVTGLYVLLQLAAEVATIVLNPRLRAPSS